MQGGGEKIKEKYPEFVTTPLAPKANQRVRRTSCPTLARTRSLSSSEIRYNLETKRKIIPKLETYTYIHIHLKQKYNPN